MLRNNYHGFRNRDSIRVAVVPSNVGRFSLALLGLLLASMPAFAKGYSAGVTPAGATFGIKFSSNGTPLATIGGTAGAVVVTQAVPLALPGAVLPVVVNAAISGAAVAGAWGAAAGVVGVAALYAIPYIKAYMDSKGIVAVGDVLSYADPTVCTTAPCYEYRFSQGATYGSWSASALTACRSLAALNLGGYVNSDVTSDGNNSCKFRSTKDGNTIGPYEYGPSTSRTVTPSSSANRPISNSEAATILASVPPTVAVVQAFVDADYAPSTTQKTTTGPASVFKGNVVSLGIDGSVQEILSRYYVSYEDMTGGLSWNVRDVTTLTPPLITTSVSKAVTTLANGNTSTATTTTTTTTPQASAGSGIVTTPKIETSVQTVVTDPQGVTVSNNTSKTGTAGTVTPPATASVDKPADPVKDPCIDNPLRVGCLIVDTPVGEIPKTSKTITYAEENVFGTGSCPANLTAAVGLLGKTVTVWDWQKTCQLALPLRAMVLILASFAAFLIVMPGGVKT